MGIVFGEDQILRCHVSAEGIETRILNSNLGISIFLAGFFLFFFVLSLSLVEVVKKRKSRIELEDPSHVVMGEVLWKSCGLK
jgi:hypothetical protein